MTEPKKYRQKPVIVEAVEFTEANLKVLTDWCNGTHRPPSTNGLSKGWISFEGREGLDFAFPGYFVVEDADGKFEAYSPEDFHAKYESVGDRYSPVYPSTTLYEELM